MKNTLLALACCIFCFATQAQLNNAPISYYMAKVPFKMAAIKEPVFKADEFDITTYGAVPNGTALNTVAFAKAIEACNKNGGGKVMVNAGTWLTGPIELLSNVNLEVKKGATILFTNNHAEYPIIKAGKSSNTFTPASPIYAYDATNIAITGEGTIDGAGDSWRPVKKNKVTEAFWKEINKTGVLSNDEKIWWPTKEALLGEAYVQKLKAEKPNATAEDYLPARDFLRPHMIFFVGCKNILLQGVTIKNSPKFVFYPSKCTDLTLKNVQVYNDWWAQNGDGIDISACKRVLIYGCTLSVGDDGLCMKSSGKNSSGEANLQDIVIVNCTVYRAHGGFVIGSNTDGGMNNIFVSNCYFNGTDIGIRVKSNAGRGGKVENIYIDSVDMDNIVNEAISFDTYYEDVVAGKEKGDVVTTARDKIPEFTNFYMSNINCKQAKTAIYMNGLADMPVNKVFITNASFNTKNSLNLNYATQVIGKNVSFGKKPNHSFKNSSNIVMNDEVLVQ